MMVVLVVPDDDDNSSDEDDVSLSPVPPEANRNFELLSKLPREQEER